VFSFLPLPSRARYDEFVDRNRLKWEVPPGLDESIGSRELLKTNPQDREASDCSTCLTTTCGTSSAAAAATSMPFTCTRPYGAAARARG